MKANINADVVAGKLATVRCREISVADEHSRRA
jgi:hypothetical protein